MFKFKKIIFSKFSYVLFICVAIFGLSEVSNSQSCFPTCDEVDGRFIAIAEGGVFETLTGGTQNVRLIVPGNSSTFSLGIFDGDAVSANGNWDNGLGGSLFTYTVISDPDRDNIGPIQFSVESTALPNNDWADFIIPNNPSALDEDGNYQYTVRIQHQEEVPRQNAFKLRSSGILEIDEPFQFLANIASASDRDIIYPNFDNSDGVDENDRIGSNYDGTFTFTYEIPDDVGTLTEIAHWDGDADHGNSDGSDPDTDDLNSPNSVPDFSPPDALDTQNEGINVSSPPDNNTPFILRVYGDAVTYSVTIPGIGTFTNNNPSGNREWEQFVISTTTDDPAIADAMAGGIPLNGTYIIQIEGLDMVNIMALNPPFPVRGEVINNPLTPVSSVPTVSEWGLIALAVIFGIMGIVVVRRRQLIS